MSHGGRRRVFRGPHRKRTFADYVKMMEYRWGTSEYGFPTVPIGKGNPYFRCKACHKSVPNVSISGHARGCRWWQMFKSVQGLRRVLEKSKQF